MQTCFKDILIPVDFGVNTEVAIRKAVAVADGNEPRFHLLHVCNRMFSPFASRHQRKGDAEVDAELGLKDHGEAIKNWFPSAKVDSTVLRSASVQEAIIGQAAQTKADLVVIGQRSTGRWPACFRTVVPAIVAQRTTLPVLTVKPGSLHNEIRNVVVPVSERLHGHRLEALKALGRKTRIRITLVSYVSGMDMPMACSASSLLQAYQWLRTLLHCPVEYAVVHGRNQTKAMLRFAEDRSADILLLNPDTETGFGWPRRSIADLVPGHSKLQVLTLNAG